MGTGGRLGVEAFAIVSNFHLEHAGLCTLQSHPRLLCARVLAHVGKRFLDNTEELELHKGRKMLRNLVRAQSNHYPVALLELFQVVLHRWQQTALRYPGA